MTPSDLRLIDDLTPTNPELAELVAQHQRYEHDLAQLADLVWLSPEEQAQVKRLKRSKLAGRDRIERILASHRAALAG